MQLAMRRCDVAIKQSNGARGHFLPALDRRSRGRLLMRVFQIVWDSRSGFLESTQGDAIVAWSLMQLVLRRWRRRDAIEQSTGSDVNFLSSFSF